MCTISSLFSPSQLAQELGEYARRTRRWLVLQLHSSLPSEQQDLVFGVPPKGNQGTLQLDSPMLLAICCTTVGLKIPVLWAYFSPRMNLFAACPPFMSNAHNCRGAESGFSYQHCRDQRNPPRHSLCGRQRQSEANEVHYPQR